MSRFVSRPPDRHERSPAHDDGPAAAIGADEAAALRPPSRIRPGTLYLIPTPLHQAPAEAADWLAPAEAARLAGLRRFAVETPKVARAWLARLLPTVPVRQLEIHPLPGADEPAPDWARWLAPMLAGESMGLLSDAGCPGIADPGAALVGAAHAAGIPVRPVVGPSAIVLALMASGLQGQRFAFHGYLPVAPAQREQAIRDLARRAHERDETQILIETPYRNQALVDSLIATLPPDAVLVIAADLSGPDEQITRHRIDRWRRAPPRLPRAPATLLFGFDPASRAAGADQVVGHPAERRSRKRPGVTGTGRPTRDGRPARPTGS